MGGVRTGEMSFQSSTASTLGQEGAFRDFHPPVWEKESSVNHYCRRAFTGGMVFLICAT